ncbi:MAG: hypothetical protein J6M17_10460 [Ruminococcus sp.]|nr:hypothetical protein [Ruminococcus sp.]
MNITRESEKLLCCMYKIYLDRRKNNISRSEAKTFDDDFYSSEKQLEKYSDSDISDCLEELEQKGYIKSDVLDNVELTNDTIIYMENRFINGAKEVLDFLCNFIP